MLLLVSSINIFGKHINNMVNIFQFIPVPMLPFTCNILYISAFEKKCPICLGILDEEEEAIQLPKCSHKFHSSCILPWLQKVLSTTGIYKLSKIMIFRFFSD